MGERGPLPRPASRRRNRRQVNASVSAGRPAMPRTLTPEARAEWRRVVPDLERMGVLASVDRGVLVRYCTAWADWSELDAQVRRTGRIVRGRDGNLVRNPLWLLRRDAGQELMELTRQLALTPAARLRSGIKVERAETLAVPASVAAIAEYRRALAP